MRGVVMSVVAKLAVPVAAWPAAPVAALLVTPIAALLAAPRASPSARRATRRRSRLAVCLLALPMLVLTSTSCTGLFFFPHNQLMQTPADRGYRFDDIWLSSADGTQLHSWLVHPQGEAVGTLYFLHGNAENISTHINAVWWLVDAGYEVLALDYRGYGLSGGKADLPEVFDDIRAGVDWLQVNRPDTPVFLYAQSLGGSLGITFLQRDAAARSYFSGLVVESAFASYGTMARHVASVNWFTWPFQYPVQWLLTADYDPVDAIGSLSPLPLLLIHSRDDEVVPFAEGVRLRDAAQPPVDFIEANGPHIRGMADEDNRAEVLTFLSR